MEDEYAYQAGRGRSIPRAQDAVPPTGIDDIVKRDLAAFVRGGVGIGRLDGSPELLIFLASLGGGRSKVDGLDLGARKDLDAALAGVVEEEGVEFGADDVPGAVGGAECDKVGVCDRGVSVR